MSKTFKMSSSIICIIDYFTLRLLKKLQKMFLCEFA